jgi:cytochrome o ubiquinol oxidase operon protein cyoD
MAAVERATGHGGPWKRARARADGVCLVFVVHISGVPDQTDKFLALVFGIFVVGLIVFGSTIVMASPNRAMMPNGLMQMRR